MIDMEKPFKILSIDGGGIRGIFPAMYLAKFEAQLKTKGYQNWHVCENFDLICGASTGGILAIGLALGIPAKDLYELYLDNAKSIFGRDRRIIRFFKKWIKGMGFSIHNRSSLEDLVKEKFESANGGVQPRLKDCKPALCIPVYDLLNGHPTVVKTQHYNSFTRDFHKPAYQVALATSAAPTYFNPYSADYEDLTGINNQISNQVDGGVIANNPTLIGLFEAQEAFEQKLSNLRVLSLGTGHQKFTDGKKRKMWGLAYWLKKARLIDLFMQAQSQLVENQVSLLQYGIDKKYEDNPRFKYFRITTELSGSLSIALDETNHDKLVKLGAKAAYEFDQSGSKIIDTFCEL